LRKAFVYLPLTLLAIGVIVFVVGLYFTYVEGIKVYYKDLHLFIPVIKVTTKWPGNYSESADIPIRLVEVMGQPLTEQWSYTYNVSIPWSNCTGGEDIEFVLGGYSTTGNTSPYVAIEVYGFDEGEYRLLLSRDTASLSDEEGVCRVNGILLHCKIMFNLSDSILNYKHINITVKPARGLIIDELQALSTLTCLFSYTLPFPINYLSRDTDFYYLRFPTHIDTSGLLNGLCFSLIGLLLILISIYLRTASGTR